MVVEYSIYKYPQFNPERPFAVHRQVKSSRYAVLGNQFWHYRVDVDEECGRAIVMDIETNDIIIPCFEFYRLWTNQDMYLTCGNIGCQRINGHEQQQNIDGHEAEDGLALIFELPDRSIVCVGGSMSYKMKLPDNDSIVQIFSIRGGSDSLRIWIEGVVNTYWEAYYFPNSKMKALFSTKGTDILTFQPGCGDKTWHPNCPWLQIYEKTNGNGHIYPRCEIIEEYA